MCGLNGFYGIAPSGLLGDMNAAISHRGPDSSGVRFFDFGGVGHVRLSIIDLSDRSNQPFSSACGRYTLVFNGEIYNYREIRYYLEGEGFIFTSDGDAEVLLNFWIYKGKDCVNQLDGIFAFAVTDIFERKIYLVRDQYGIKPLYYATPPNAVLFSSEIKAILQHPDVSRELDHSAILRTLSFLWSPGRDTVLRHVKKVIPGEIITIVAGQVLERERYYFAPTYKASLSKVDAIEQLRVAIKESVESQLVSDVEVGAFLSGGLDSSLICALAKSLSSGFKNVFTISVDQRENRKEAAVDDLPYAKKVAELFELNLNVVEANSNIVSLLPEALYHLDEPQADPAVLNTFLICRLAKEKGIKVLLSGAGGDDLYTGYRRHYAAHLGEKLDCVPSPLRKLIAQSADYIPLKSGFLRRLAKFLATVGENADDRIFKFYCWTSKEKLLRLFKNKDVVSESDIFSVFRERLFDAELDGVEKCLLLDRDFFLVDHNLNYTDKMSMAHGVEVRVPFVSRRHVDLASRIPTEIKQKGKVGKWILKKAAEQWLPNEVIYRPKTGFGAPLRAWVHGPLAGAIESLLGKESINQRGLFDYEEVKQMIEEDKRGQGDYAYTIYALLSLEIWLRQFVDQDKPKLIDFKAILEIG